MNRIRENHVAVLAGMCALTVLVALGMNSAKAGIIADFEPEPASPALPELIWDGSELYEGPGAIGTGFGVAGPGDGELPTAVQDIPGLLLESPFTVAGVPGSEINTTTGATTFFDVTLDISATAPGAAKGLRFSGPAVAFAGAVVQPLGPGAFEIWSTDPDESPGTDVENPVLLLGGTIDTAVITGILGSSTGAMLSATVTYTAGKIVDAAPAGVLWGELSWSLLDIQLPLAIDGGSDLLRPFEGNAVGQFSGIPEPGTLALLGLGAAILLGRRRRG